MTNLILFPPDVERQDRQMEKRLQTQRKLFEEMHANLLALLQATTEFNTLTENIASEGRSQSQS